MLPKRRVSVDWQAARSMTRAITVNRLNQAPELGVPTMMFPPEFIRAE
jgi:hypothetical protein